MKSLFLVRHAHAAEGGDDHERGLTPHGEQAAIRAGNALAQTHCQPQLALLSTAARVTQTWRHIERQLSATPRVAAERSLYLADPDSMHEQLTAIADSVESVVLVAHNPGISELAVRLTAAGPSVLRHKLQLGFAPAAVASLAFSAATWSEVGACRGKILGFWD